MMSEKKPSAMLGAGVLLQLSSAIVVAIIVPLLVGIWLSRQFNLGPIAIVVVLALGLLLGSLAIAKIIRDAYAQLDGGKNT